MREQTILVATVPELRAETAPIDNPAEEKFSEPAPATVISPQN